MKEGGRKREKEERKLGRRCQCEGLTPDVDLTVETKNVERLIPNPEGV
jgi:hypothetical protein